MNDQTSPESRPHPYRWIVLGVWLFTSVSGFMVMSVVGILLPAISLDLSLSPSQQGMLGSAAFWGNVLLAIPLSWLTSRFSPKLLTTVTLALGALALFVQGWAPVFAVLLLGRLMFGLMVIARQPARSLLTQQWFPPREFVMANSVGNALFGLVVGGGLIATPFILANLGDSWRGTLHAFGAYFILLTILWAVFGRERATTHAPRSRTSLAPHILKSVLSYRDLWVQGFGFVGPTLVWSAFLSFFPTLMLGSYEIPLQWSGGILALGILMGGISGLVVGYVDMHTGKGRVIMQSLAALMLATYVGMVLIPSIPLLLLLSFVNGIAWGFWPVLFTVPFHLPNIRPREVAIAVSFTLMMTSLGTALGPLSAGFLQEALGDLRMTLLILSFAPLSLAVAASILRLERLPSSEESIEAAQPGD